MIFKIIFSFESFNISKDYIISVKLAQILWYYRHVNYKYRALRAWLENLLLTWAGVSSLVWIIKSLVGKPSSHLGCSELFSLDHQELGWKTFFSLGLE